MFNLFNNRKTTPTVTKEDQEWIEKNLAWFIEVFGLNRVRQKPFLFPTYEDFPYSDLTLASQFQSLFIQICKCLEVDPEEIIVNFYDDIRSKERTNWVVHEKLNEPIGQYYQTYTTDHKRFNIQIAKSVLDNSQLLVYVLAHELAHVKLLGGNYIERNDDMEPLTDLACIYFGFGLLFANTVLTKDAYGVSRSGYLPNQLISYTNALLCYITENAIDNYLPLLNANTKDLFKQDYEFLVAFGPCLLTFESITNSEEKHKYGLLIAEAFETRKFDEVINCSGKLLEKDDRNTLAYNNIGYALLQQKKYSEAIQAFNKAIDLDPYWYYPYNNRGYCKLQLEEMESAFTDLHSSFQMNPENSYSWRNLGAYYLATGEFEKARNHFEEAEKIDPETEMINFYLSRVHLKLDNADLAHEYSEKSKKLDEHNDSIL